VLMGLGEEINYQWTVKPAAEQTENAADSESLAEGKAASGSC
jgi:hypothetical protein